MECFCSICAAFMVDESADKFQPNLLKKKNYNRTAYSEIIDEFNLITSKNSKLFFCPSCEESMEKLTNLKSEMDKLSSAIKVIVSLLKSKVENRPQKGKIYF